MIPYDNTIYKEPDESMQKIKQAIIDHGIPFTCWKDIGIDDPGSYNSREFSVRFTNDIKEIMDEFDKFFFSSVQKMANGNDQHIRAYVCEGQDMVPKSYEKISVAELKQSLADHLNDPERSNYGDIFVASHSIHKPSL